MPASSEIVSRETIEKLTAFEALIQRWSPKINLVSARDLANLRERHIEDSIQIYHSAPENIESWIDLGTGGGFPGVVCALLATQRSPETVFTLVEADTRKAAFLREAARQLGLDVTILSDRIENLPRSRYDVISARALAPLPRLLAWSFPVSGPTTTFLFPKGRQAETELTQARQSWKMEVERISSRTDSDAMILKITDLRPKS